MQSIETAPLAAEHRADCAVLLAQRYDRQRAAEPLLPEIEDFEAHVPGTGVVAIRGDRIVAYLAGEVHDDVATVGFAGCAAMIPEAIRDCFAALGADWGVERFAVAVPAFEHDLVDAWFRLGFGCQFVWAVRATELVEPPDFGGTIRAGTPGDLDAVVAFDKILWDLQALSPSFSGLETPSLDELRAEWSDLWSHPDVYSHFVAERDGRAVGHALLYGRPAGDLRVPKANLDLSALTTLAEIRGTGVGTALAAHALNHAFAGDFRSVTADWRSVNLLASRFWPQRGYRPQYLRLYRSVP
jgi:GNAT superfamily N-acetyltransferase